MSLTKISNKVVSSWCWGAWFIQICNPESHYLQSRIKCNIRNSDERKHILLTNKSSGNIIYLIHLHVPAICLP